MKLSVCIDAVLAEQPIEQALQTVRAAGIPAFEFWGWWERDLAAVRKAATDQQLALAACCTKFISLVDSQQRAAYLQGLEESIAAAGQLGTRTLISQVGDFLPAVPRQQQRQSLVDGLKAAVPMLAAADMTLVIEPLNELVDHAGYYLIRSDEAFQIIDEVGSPHVKVIYDIYHQQISEGHLIHNITQNIDKIAHFHAAGNPGRHELTCGEIHYPAVFDAIRRAGYSGYVGLEYWPQQDPLQGLREVAGWQAAE